MSSNWWPGHGKLYLHLSSTWCEFDPYTAYAVCISICPYFLIWYPYAPTSLYGDTAHCSGYGVAMGCHRLCIVPRTAIVTSQWYDRYCFTEYARTWARHPTTPWQRDYRLSIDRFFEGFNAICSTFLRNNPICIEGCNCRLSTVLGYSINARAVGPRTPFRVGGLAGDSGSQRPGRTCGPPCGRWLPSGRLPDRIA